MNRPLNKNSVTTSFSISYIIVIMLLLYEITLQTDPLHPLQNATKRGL